MSNENLAMLYEDVALIAFEKQMRGSDPFKLGDANHWDLLKNEVSGVEGFNVKFALSYAVRKLLISLKDEVNAAEKLDDLHERIVLAKHYHELADSLNEVHQWQQHLKAQQVVDSGK
ncbi:hypothetical protein [Chitinophaga caseinilytica]|uniref:Uncharacterized protein n=1 Tax=Chitinophaga caseinilytica TaxID=2267521 RepID=A0ABZ2Z7I9_9BACT